MRFDERVVEDFGPYLGQVGKLTGVTDDFALLASVEGELQELLGGAAAAHPPAHHPPLPPAARARRRTALRH